MFLFDMLKIWVERNGFLDEPGWIRRGRAAGWPGGQPALGGQPDRQVAKGEPQVW